MKSRTTARFRNSNSSPAAWEHVHWNTLHNFLTALAIPHDDLDPVDYPPKL